MGWVKRAAVPPEISRKIKNSFSVLHVGMQNDYKI